MSVILDFNTPTVWELNSQAHVEADPTSPTPPNVLRMQFSYNDSAAWHTLQGLIVGHQYRVFVKCNFDGVEDQSGFVRLRYADIPEYLNALMFKDLSVSGWEIRDVGTLTYAVADGLLRFVGVGSTGSAKFASVYVVDESEMGPEVLVLGKWGAIENAIAVLKGINGAASASKTDLGGRVHTELFDPLDDPKYPRPYACMPLVNDGETVDYEGFMFTATWRLSLYGYFDNDPDNKLEATGARLAANFRDDVIRAFMLDQHLGGQTVNVEVKTVDSRAGVIGLPFAETEMSIVFTQMGSADDLAAG